jgi:hypothetical protein
MAPLATGGPTPGVDLTPALTPHKPDGVGLWRLFDPDHMRSGRQQLSPLSHNHNVGSEIGASPILEILTKPYEVKFEFCRIAGLQRPNASQPTERVARYRAWR